MLIWRIFQSSNPPFTSVELDHSDSGREGCTVTTLTVTADPQNWRNAIKVAVQEVCFSGVIVMLYIYLYVYICIYALVQVRVHTLVYECVCISPFLQLCRYLIPEEGWGIICHLLYSVANFLFIQFCWFWYGFHSSVSQEHSFLCISG